MAQSRFTGPVKSDNGFIGEIYAGATGPILTATASPKASLPAATPALAGQVRMVSDASGPGTFALVICTGSAWVLADGTALP